MTDSPHKPVLADHVKVKKKLLSPFMAKMQGTFAPYSWAKQLVPEAIWLALIIDKYGFEIATGDCVDLVITTTKTLGRHDAPMFAKLSAFAILTDKEKNEILCKNPPCGSKRICIALSSLSDLIIAHPLSFLNSDKIEVTDIECFVRVLNEIYDRNSRLSVLSMALAYFLGIRQGKVHVAAHLIDGFLQSFSKIGNYPESEASREAAGRFRATAPMIFMSMGEVESKVTVDNDWMSTFWDHISGLGACVSIDTLNDEPADETDPIAVFVIGFRNAVRSDLRARLERWEVDLQQVETYEVAGSLLARQATLALDLAGAPSLWTPHAAPILLRAMADVFITLVWILKKPAERSKIFVDDGLGAVKLMIAHQEQAIAKATDSDDIEAMQQMIDTWKDWLAYQRLDVFVEVNLGSWSGMSTRRMAEETGFIDFYNHVYQPFSGAAHSNWFHLSSFNSLFCENPAHRGHLIPAIVRYDPDTYWLYLAAKYLTKTLAHFDEVNGLVGLGHRLIKREAKFAAMRAGSTPGSCRRACRSAWPRRGSA